MRCDFLIIGGGVIGLATARALQSAHPGASITLIDKEPDVARHASGRNSGVLHAGFYYTADSLKARFCRDGNRAWHAYCAENGLPLNPCRKLVVACDEQEVEGLRELKRRGDANGVPVEIIDEKQAAEIEPHARTCGYALLSPTTATVNPGDLCRHLKSALAASGVRMLMRHPYLARVSGNTVRAGDETIEAGVVVNCAGLYASRIARDFGFARDFTILPFKGVYVKYTGIDKPLKTLLYSVPDMRKPFLGVHFAVAADGSLKIGPTAIPAFWRENYHGLSGFSLPEMLHILGWQARLFAGNAFNFRTFAYEEMRKYSMRYLVRHAMRMAKGLDASKFSQWSTAGIRAQLLNTKTLALVQDFTVEGDAKSVHVLNANSPAFTSSLPFAEWVVKEWIRA
jgi:L-2-hydroxyglutarate oxidase LhgO